METDDVPEGSNKTILLVRKWEFKEKIGETVVTSFEGERTNTGHKSSTQVLFFTFTRCHEVILQNGGSKQGGRLGSKQAENRK